MSCARANGSSIDDAMGAAVDALRRSGRSVAVISNRSATACAAADVAIGIVDEGCPPPWCADVLIDDLSALWWILHAVPAAKSASRRGVEIATGASILGGLMLVPGVRGRGGGPGPITVGAAAGQWTGYRLARRALQADAPAPAPPHNWHAMSAEAVRRVLPPPSQDAAQRRTNPVEQQVGRMIGAARDSVARCGPNCRTRLPPCSPPVRWPARCWARRSTQSWWAPYLSAMRRWRPRSGINAERVLSQLLAVQVPKARKVRGSDYVTTNADALQPGDVIEVRADEVVPADARVVEGRTSRSMNPSLTGESLPVAKHVEATPGAPLAERVLHALRR